MANWKAGGAGALSGAASGAAIGSVIPGVGTAIGAGVGGVAGGLLGLFGGAKKDKFRQLQNLTPEQQQYLNQVVGQLQNGQTGQNYGASQNYLQGLLSGDPGIYDRFKAPFVQNFEQQILPRIAEQFAGAGGAFGQGLNSSGFGQALGGAGAQLEAQLSGQFANLQNQASQQAMNQYNQLSGFGLGTRSFENAYQPGTTGLAGPTLSGFAQGAGNAFGNWAGNRMGPMGQNNQMMPTVTV